MKNVIRIIFGLILVGIFVWTLMFLYNKSQKRPVMYDTESPFVTNIIKKAVATGSVVPRKEVEIKPQVSGIIEKIYVEAGQKIEKGDLVAKVKIIPNMVTLNNAESRVNKAKIVFNDAQRNLNRNKKLFEDEVIAEATFQKIQLEYENAKEDLEFAKNNVQLIREGVTKKLGTATNTLIRSTISGMVLDVPVKEGNSVIESNNFNAGTTIASIADMNQMIFEGKVDESEVGKVKPDMDLLLTIGAIEEEKFTAKLEYISPKGVEEEGAIQFEIKAAMELKEDHFIRAGYSANADIVLESKDSVLAIHESLLQFNSDTPYVEVETKPMKFEKRYIEVGLSDGINIEVLSGLDTTDKIKVWNKPIEEED